MLWSEKRDIANGIFVKLLMLLSDEKIQPDEVNAKMSYPWFLPLEQIVCFISGDVR